MTAKFQTYTVCGIWPFPLDMLRHDDAHPLSAEDGAMIERLSGDYAPDRAAFKPVQITLVGRRPNTARWESFGWSVPSDREHAMVKRWREEEARRQELLQSALAKLTPEEREVVSAAIKAGEHH